MECTRNTKNWRSQVVGRLTLHVVMVCWLALATQEASAQTYNVIYRFTGNRDGASPFAGVTLDSAGNLYGTASYGGPSTVGCFGTGCGTVYKLSRGRAGWLLTPLYNFTGQSDGGNPQARVVFGPSGLLYGTTFVGGNGICPYGMGGCGTVFSLTPPPSVCKSVDCFWAISVLYTFQGNSDGTNPSFGDLVFDPRGNIYGTTIYGGENSRDCSDAPCGVVYELSPSQSGWTESVLYRFNPGPPGNHPYAGVILDSSGNLYGTTPWGCFAPTCTSVYELSPGANGWVETTLYTFNDPTGISPMGGLIFDHSGNLYGTTSDEGAGGNGTVFELVPQGGNSTLTTLHNFIGNSQLISAGPTATLVMDAAGNLYGTTHIEGAYQNGSIFKLSPSNGGWTFTSLHDFTGGADGGQPWGQLVLDTNGNIFGTTTMGGNNSENCGQGCGVVFEITPD